MVHLIFDDFNSNKYNFSNIFENVTQGNRVELFSTSDKETVDKTIDDLFWKLGFNPTTKGTTYLKKAISIASDDLSLLYDNKKLLSLVSNEFNGEFKAVRSAIDNSINSMYRYSSDDKIKIVFKDNYDGRKPSTKYFIALCVNYSNEKNNKETANMIYFE